MAGEGAAGVAAQLAGRVPVGVPAGEGGGLIFCNFGLGLAHQPGDEHPFQILPVVPEGHVLPEDAGGVEPLVADLAQEVPLAAGLDPGGGGSRRRGRGQIGDAADQGLGTEQRGLVGRKEGNAVLVGSRNDDQPGS